MTGSWQRSGSVNEKTEKDETLENVTPERERMSLTGLDLLEFFPQAFCRFWRKWYKPAKRPSPPDRRLGERVRRGII